MVSYSAHCHRGQELLQNPCYNAPHPAPLMPHTGFLLSSAASTSWPQGLGKLGSGAIRADGDTPFTREELFLESIDSRALPRCLGNGRQCAALVTLLSGTFEALVTKTILELPAFGPLL